MKPSTAKVKKIIKNVIESLTNLILGKPGDLTNLDRQKWSYLITVLTVSLFIFCISIGIDVFYRFDPFTFGKLGMALSIIIGLTLVHHKKYGPGIGFVFLGQMISASLGAFFALRWQNGTMGYVVPVAVQLFAMITLGGLYSASVFLKLLLFLEAVIFDLAYSILKPGPVTFPDIQAGTGLVLLHGVAFGVALYLRIYLKQFENLLEARRIMGIQQEKTIEAVRLEGRKKLESFSHDIRSPVTSIMGVQALLATTNLSEEQRGYMDILAKSNRVLLDMVQGILEPAMDSETGQVTAEEIKRIIDSTIHSYQALAETKGVFIQTRVAKDVPPLPLSKSDTIRVVGNLVDNALKYTDAGYIYIQVAKPSSPGTDGVILSVQDTGRGMTSERIQEVLSGNLRPDTEFSTSRGLGLAGVRTLLEERGGTLDIDSEPGRGTKITIRFYSSPG